MKNKATRLLFGNINKIGLCQNWSKWKDTQSEMSKEKEITTGTIDFKSKK